MFASHASISFWGEAILTASYLINCLPSKSFQFRTLLSVLFEIPQVRLLKSLQPKVFGCTVFVYDHSPTRGKLDSRAIKCWIPLVKKSIDVITPFRENF